MDYRGAAFCSTQGKRASGSDTLDLQRRVGLVYEWRRRQPSPMGCVRRGPREGEHLRKIRPAPRAWALDGIWSPLCVTIGRGAAAEKPLLVGSCSGAAHDGWILRRSPWMDPPPLSAQNPLLPVHTAAVGSWLLRSEALGSQPWSLCGSSSTD